VRRELSAGGVVVRRLRGGWRLAAIRPGGKDVWALPKGLIATDESPAETAARETPRWQAWIQERFPMPTELSKSE